MGTGGRMDGWKDRKVKTTSLRFSSKRQGTIKIIYRFYVQNKGYIGLTQNYRLL